MKNKELKLMYKELDYGVDTQNNIIYLSETLSITDVRDVSSRLEMCRKVNGDKPIDLILSSYGGDVYSMLGIIDYMRLMDVKVNTRCYGAAMSAAAVILACGTGERTMSKNATVMIHEGSIFEEGKISDVLKSSDHLKELHKTINKILSEVTNKDEEYWTEKTKTDLYLTAEECLEFKIIDKIEGV
jgi:ATP-dependent Clp protease protease subunit|tara:strand:+ start:65 stop:622 length:558 start_codon:yes stop_codon:yes gene_type:complete